MIVEFRVGTTWWTEIAAIDNVRITEGAITTQPRFDQPTIQSGNVVLTWTGTGRLEESSTLAPNSWSPVPGNPVSGFMVSPGSAPAKFYRIVSQ